MAITKEEIKVRVNKVLIDVIGVDEDELTDEANLCDDLGADSLDHVEVIMEIEKEFSITIPDEDAEGLKTVGSIVAFVEERVSY